MKQRPWHYTFAALAILAVFNIAGCEVFSRPNLDPNLDPNRGRFVFSLEGDSIIINGYLGDARGRHITIPQSIGGIPVTRIRSSAFLSRGIDSVYIPYGITSIGQNAFWRNQLSKVYIPNSVTEIGLGAFTENQLTEVTLPPRVIISLSAFNHNHLRSLYIPLKVEFGSSAFANNRLKHLYLADGFGDEIASWAFASNRLEDVVIPPSVTTIHMMAFADNPLTRITIGADVKFIIPVNDPNVPSYSSFGHGFEEFYIASGRRAGTYVRTSATSTDWRLLE